MDLNQIIQAAAEAALKGQGPNNQQSLTDKAKDKRKGMTTPRALLIGAGMFTVGRLLVGSRGRDVLGDLQERLAIYESEHFGAGGSEDGDEDEEFDDEPEGEYDEDDEPEGEYDNEEEPEGEYEEDDGPEGEYDEEEEPEGEYDEDEEPEGEYDEEEEPEDQFDEEESEGEFDEDEEPEAESDEDEEPEGGERPRRRRRASAAGSSRNGRH